jgi:hypothetical protein
MAGKLLLIGQQISAPLKLTIHAAFGQQLTADDVRSIIQLVGASSERMLGSISWTLRLSGRVDRGSFVFRGDRHSRRVANTLGRKVEWTLN